MKAIILAAGKGSRIGSDNLGIPKSFLKINGKKIIQHQIDSLRAMGVKNIVIVIGYKSQLFEKEFSNQKDIILIKNPFYEKCNVLGSLWFAGDHMNEEFYFLHADTLFDQNILKLLNEQAGDVRFAVEFKETNEEEMKVRVVNGQVVEVNKTMRCSSAQGEFTGVALISSKVSDQLKIYINKIIEVDQEHQAFFEHVIQTMIDDKKINVKAVDIGKNRSVEIDFPEDYERAKKLFQ